MKINTKYKKKLIFNQNISTDHTPIKLKQIETIKEEESNEKTPNNIFINSTNNLLKNFTINKKYNISFLLKSLNKKELSDNITKIFSNRSLSTPQNYNNNNNNIIILILKVAILIIKIIIIFLLFIKMKIK